jgi:hypothetical protein
LEEFLNEKYPPFENKCYDFILIVLRGRAILGVIAVHTSQHGRFDVPKIVQTHCCPV